MHTKLQLKVPNKKSAVKQVVRATLFRKTGNYNLQYFHVPNCYKASEFQDFLKYLNSSAV